MSESKDSKVHEVIRIDYTVKNTAGEIIDTTEGQEPMAFIKGTDAILPGLEKALSDKKVGEEVRVVLSPEDAYGVRDEELVMNFPRDQFPDDMELSAGLQFQVQTDHGTRVLTIVDVAGDEVKVDSNHPLAGVELHFAAEIVEIRQATPEEISHGHVHGPGGHHH